MNYVDRYGLYNVKPCIDGNPSGNDGWILTAYAKKLGLEVDTHYLSEAWFYLEKGKHIAWLPIERLENKKTPYVSRDVILAMSYLGMTNVRQVRLAGWNFSPLPLPKLNIIKLIHQLWQLRGKHRNTFWKEPGYEQVFHAAFMVPLQDRAAIYRFSGETPPLIYRLIEWADKIIVKPKNNSSKLIRWLKYDQKPSIKVFEEYFGIDHPITKAARI